MEDNISSTDVDDAKILAKFNSLLNKYQNQGRLTGAANSLVPDATLVSQPNQISNEKEADAIPTLTEVVLLPPSVIQPQPKRITPIEQILDAALEDARIELDAAEKRILANALDARLGGQLK